MNVEYVYCTLKWVNGKTFKNICCKTMKGFFLKVKQHNNLFSPLSWHFVKKIAPKILMIVQIMDLIPRTILSDNYILSITIWCFYRCYILMIPSRIFLVQTLQLKMMVG